MNGMFIQKLEEMRCFLSLITLPVAMSPPTNFEMNLMILKVVEVRLSRRQSQETRFCSSIVSVSNKVERWKVNLK